MALHAGDLIRTQMEREAAQAQAAERADAGTSPPADLNASEEYKRHLARGLCRRALEQAAAAMVRGGFRHLVVVNGTELAGMLSMRDIVRCWTTDGATSEVQAVAEAGG